MADLHTRLVAALQARLEVARAATPGPWTVWSADGRSVEGPDGDHVVASVAARKNWPSREDAAHIAANDPATEIRRVEALLRVVERHAPYPHPNRAGIVQCDHCAAQCHSRSGLACDSPADAIFPCDDIRDLAAAEGIEVDQ